MKHFLILLLLLCNFSLKAQENLISSSISMSATMPANMAEWASQMPPVLITAQAKLDKNRSLPAEVIESRILVSIKNGSSLVCGDYTPTTAAMAGFNSTVMTWRGADVEKLIGNKTCVLRPGQYTLCVQFYNYEGKAISDERCKPFSVAGASDASYTAPQNIMPADGKVFTTVEIKQPFIFRWTPLLPKPKEKIMYKLRVFEVRKGQVAAEAVKSGNAIFEKEITDQTQYSGANATAMGISANDNKYAWLIEAADAQGKVLGRSEVSLFSVNAQYLIQLDSLKITCSPTPGNYGFSIQIKNPNPTQATLNSVDLLSSIPSGATISSFFPPIGTIINPGNQLIISGVIIGSASINNLCIGAKIRDVISSYREAAIDSCVKVLPCNVSQCNCGNWGSITIGRVKYKCSETIDWKCGEKLNFSNVYQCNPNDSICNATTKWEVKLGSSSVASGLGTNLISGSFTPTSAGVYTITMNAKCGDKTCEPCVLTVKVSGPCEPIECCKGSKWGKNYFVLDGVVKDLGSPNSNLGVFKCKELIPITTNFDCGQNCGTAQIKYELFQGMMPIHSQTVNSGTPYNLTVPSNTTMFYTLNITAICNGKVCSALSYTFGTTCDSIPKDCCKGSKWVEMFEYINGGVVSRVIPKALPECDSKLGLWECGSTKQLKVCYSCNPDCGKIGATIKYEVFKAGSSVPVSTTTVASCDMANIPVPNVSGIYSIKISAYCGDKPCNTCTYYFEVKCQPKCECGSWGKVEINKVQYNSGKVIEWKCKQPVNFNASYNCNPATKLCLSTIKWVVNGPLGVVSSGSGTGAITETFTPTTNGTYTITMSPICGGVECKPYTIQFVVKCDECKCGEWDKLSYTFVKNNLYQPIVQLSTASNSAVTAELGLPYTFITKLNCTDSSCKATYDSALVYNEAGVLVGKSMLENYIFTKCGKYKIVLSGTCGDVKCGDYIINVNIPCEKICVDCKNLKLQNATINVQSGNQFTVQGNVSSTGSPIIKVAMELETFAANNNLGTTPPPFPNFEFLNNSQINGTTVLLIGSLTGSRSNMLVSNYSTPTLSVSFNINIDNYTGKRNALYRIKVTTYRQDGTYCVDFLTNILRNPRF